MRISSLVLFVILIIPKNSIALYIPRGMEEAVVLIETTESQNNEIVYSRIGTGFLIAGDSIGNNVFLVTNAHVLDNRDSVIVRFNILDGTSMRQTAHLTDISGNPFWKSHPDSTIDLAAVPIPANLQIKFIRPRRIKLIKDVQLGDEVLFLGFPLAQYVGEKKNFPIVRHGIVSFIVKEAIYSISNPDSVILSPGMMLIDATILPGNSGSPVLSTPINQGGIVSIIGIIKGYLHKSDTLENLDFGIVVPSEKLLELFDLF